MTREKEPQSKRASSPFCDFFSLGAGVTPAEGSMKPTAGFILIKFRSPSQFCYRFFRAFFLDSRVFACSLDFFRLRRRLISFCRSLAI
jgi:hypothetical protein